MEPKPQAQNQIHSLISHLLNFVLLVLVSELDQLLSIVSFECGYY